MHLWFFIEVGTKMMKKFLFAGAALCALSVPANAATYIVYEMTGSGNATFYGSNGPVSTQNSFVTATLTIDPAQYLGGCPNYSTECYPTGGNRIVVDVRPIKGPYWDVDMFFSQPPGMWPTTSDAFLYATYAGSFSIGSVPNTGPIQSVHLTGTLDKLTVKFVEGTLTPGLTVTYAAVPEPESWAMMIGGFALAGAALRRRQSFGVSFQRTASSRAA